MKEDAKTIHIRKEIGSITTHSAAIKEVIREYYNQLMFTNFKLGGKWVNFSNLQAIRIQPV